MKNCVYLFLMGILFCFFNSSSLSAQHVRIKKDKTYKIWVFPEDGSRRIKGFLRSYEDSLLVISNLRRTNFDTINIKDIERIKFRKKGRSSVGAGLGALSGLVLAISEAARTPVDPDAWVDLSQLDALDRNTKIFVPVAALLGGLLSAIRSDFPFSKVGRMVDEELLRALIAN